MFLKVHHNFVLLFIVALVFTLLSGPKISLAAGSIAINEIMANPVGEDTGAEWIKLYNPTGDSIDLTGWQLNPVSGKYYTFPSFSLAPQSIVTIHWRADGADSSGDLFASTALSNINIGNKSGWVALFKSSVHSKDMIVDYIEYGEAGKTWESTAVAAGIWIAGQFIPSPEEGQTLKLKTDGQDNNSVDDWLAFEEPTSASPSPSPEATPTPSSSPAPNETPASSPATNEPAYKNFSTKIFINEFMPWPGAGKEWVEINNLDTETIDLSGWQIDDGPEASSAQTIPVDTLIEPNQLLVVQLNKDILNNDGDQIRLIWPDNQVLHAVSFQKALKDFSSARFDNGLWLWTDQPTPGKTNIKSSAKQTTEEKNEQSAQMQIAVLNEKTTEINNSAASNSGLASAKNIASPATEINRLASQGLQPASAIDQLARKDIANEPARSNSSKIFLYLFGIIGLGLIAGFSLIYFKRRLTQKETGDKI